MKKQIELYEIESISNSKICTIAVIAVILKNLKIEPSTTNTRVWDKTLKEWISKIMLKE